MQFNGRGHEKVAFLPPVPEYEPEVEREKEEAGLSFPLLNIVIQVVGSRGIPILFPTFAAHTHNS